MITSVDALNARYVNHMCKYMHIYVVTPFLGFTMSPCLCHIVFMPHAHVL